MYAKAMHLRLHDRLQLRGLVPREPLGWIHDRFLRQRSALNSRRLGRLEISPELFGLVPLRIETYRKYKSRGKQPRLRLSLRSIQYQLSDFAFEHLSP